jgi:hypothetical protein
MFVETGLLHSRANESPPQVLAGLGRKAHYAATEFTDMDQRNAAKLLAVRCSSAA